MVRFYTQTIQVDVVTVILAGGAQAAVHAANITTTQPQQSGIILALVFLFQVSTHSSVDFTLRTPLYQPPR